MRFRKNQHHAQRMLFGGRYASVRTSPAGECFYCGERATGLDHCPPLAFTEGLGPAWALVRHYLLPTCGDCGRRLSATRVLETPSQRAGYLATRVGELFERRCNLWSDDEIQEMSPDFQRTIRARQVALMGLGKRVRRLERCALAGDEWADEWTA